MVSATKPIKIDTPGDARRLLSRQSLGAGGDDALIAGGSGVSQGTNDGTALPLQNGAATTLTVTLDANVTVSDMKVRLVTFYSEYTAPSA